MWGRGPASALGGVPEHVFGEHVSSAPYCRCCVFMVSYSHIQASLVAQMVKNLPAMQETRVQPLGREDPLEKDMATHSSTLVWRIPWAEEPGGLQSWGHKESDMTERLSTAHGVCRHWDYILSSLGGRYFLRHLSLIMDPLLSFHSEKISCCRPAIVFSFQFPSDSIFQRSLPVTYPPHPIKCFVFS